MLSFTVMSSSHLRELASIQINYPPFWLGSCKLASGRWRGGEDPVVCNVYTVTVKMPWSSRGHFSSGNPTNVSGFRHAKLLMARIEPCLHYHMQMTQAYSDETPVFGVFCHMKCHAINAVFRVVKLNFTYQTNPESIKADELLDSEKLSKKTQPFIQSTRDWIWMFKEASNVL